jgi:hypothetical protein
MQLTEKRKRHDNYVSANELHRWSPTVADFLSETISASAKGLAQVSGSHVGLRTSLTSTASVPPEWMAQGGPPLTDIIRSNFVTPGVQDRTVTRSLPEVVPRESRVARMATAKSASFHFNM